MRRVKINVLCDCDGWWPRRGGLTRSRNGRRWGFAGGVGCPVRGVIWAVQREAFHQQSSPQQLVGEERMCCSDLDCFFFIFFYLGRCLSDL